MRRPLERRLLQTTGMHLFRASLLTTTLFASSLANAETVVEYSDEPLRLGSWNLIAGGVGGRGDLLHGEVGFSMLSAAYHHSVSRRMTLGGMIGFDYANWAPDDTVGAAIVLAAPIRIGLHETPRYGFTLRMTPGLYLGFDQEYRSDFIPGLWLDFGVSGGYRFDRHFILGAGLDVPIMVGFPTEGGRDAFVAIPILVGPMAEWHVTEEWAFSADLKFGPHIMSDDFYGTRFGARFLLGLAYHL